MTKKPAVKNLKKDADKFWSRYIRLRDSDRNGYGECISCGARKHWKDAQCGHFVSRKTSTLRYDEQNCNLQCVGCNMFKSGEQYAYSLSLDLKYGTGTARRLHDRRFETHSFTIGELQDIIKEAKEQVSVYEEIRGSD